MICPKCERDWNPDTEQAMSVELFKECYSCKFGEGNGNKAEQLRLFEAIELRLGREIYPVLRGKNNAS